MKNTSKSPELKRFLSIHEQLYLLTLRLLKNLADEVYSDIPIQTNAMFLGSRVNKINIGNLLRHLIIAENHWIECIKNAVNDDIIPVPKNTKILEGIPDGKKLMDKYIELYEKGVKTLNTYTNIDLEKQVSFFNRAYTGMGFLWVIFGHHSYHLGQIDMIMRQNNINPTEYMEWENDKTTII